MTGTGKGAGRMPARWIRAISLLGLGFCLACQGDLREPVGLVPPDSDDVLIGGGGGGNGGGGSTATALTGTWLATFIFRTETDVQRHDVTWSFRPDGSCSRTVAVTSVLEGLTHTTTTACTWVSANGSVAITYAHAPSPVTFRWSVPTLSRDTLVLDGVEYQRVG